MTRLIALALVALMLSGCKEEVAERPLPVTMTAEAVGHYCQMDLLEHPGPKAQVHLSGLPDPLFFSQVRDAIAYQRMPEQSHAIAAIYVSDMGAAPSWEAPGADNWIAAETAVYVVGATVAGGMGAPELIPFADRAAAEDFVARNGGEILSLLSVPDETVLAPVEFRLDDEGNFIPPEGAAID
ncbi:nitrous oxide reductase accessory protein NosL [Tropicibacter sp. S64]|uniref:nitrous oxide reductase accessory protein NosL n=1 Tax=Tropicibacter sp. S64 TaxID=3415122 RepID=UPI003C7C6E40